MLTDRLPKGFVAAEDAFVKRCDEFVVHIPRKLKYIADESNIEFAFKRMALCFYYAKYDTVLSEKNFKFCYIENEFAGMKIIEDTFR